MNVDGSTYIQIANPMSENYEFVRPSIIPSLLESEVLVPTQFIPTHFLKLVRLLF